MITYADAFHLAKWLIQHEATASGFVSNFIPSEAGHLDLKLAIQPVNLLKKLHLYLPSFNSLNKVCAKDTIFNTNVLQTDVNLYSVFSDLLQNHNGAEEKMPESFRDAINVLEEIVEANEDPYWCALIEHEIKLIYENASKDCDRVY